MCKLIPSVVKLQVHLEDQQAVIHNHDINSAKRALERNTLTENFKMNGQDEETTEYKFDEFSQYFVWRKSDKTWHMREQNIDKGSSIGQIIHIHPKQGEKLYLCSSLNKRTGAILFEDFCTVDGNVHPTYNKATCKIELLENDMHWEAALCGYSASFRSLFCSILLHGDPTTPLQLYESMMP